MTKPSQSPRGQRPIPWLFATVYRASPLAVWVLLICTVLAGALPTTLAYVSKLVVDGVVEALSTPDGWARNKKILLRLVALEAAVMTALVIAQRTFTFVQTVLKTRLANRVSEQVLERVVHLPLSEFEGSETQETITRARREVDTKPIGIVIGCFFLLRQSITLASGLALLVALSPLALAVVAMAGVPSFVAELWFSSRAFEQWQRSSPLWREHQYIENLLTREEHAKEWILSGFGKTLLGRYKRLSTTLEQDAEGVLFQRTRAALVLHVLGTSIFYLAYAWIVHRTVNERLTLGQMTLYLSLFRQAQTGVGSILGGTSSLLEDRLYLNELHGFLHTTEGETKEELPSKDADKPNQDREATSTALLEARKISFAYPDQTEPVIRNLSLTVHEGETLALVGENGSGKSTLLKLLVGLYKPQEGVVLLRGKDLRAWNPDDLQREFSFLFQDFAHYKLKLGENVGAGAPELFEDQALRDKALVKSGADSFVRDLPEGTETWLGRWYRGGHELSGGQWQKLALARAFMRQDAAIKIFDEPTASLDARSEQGLEDALMSPTPGSAHILVSHRIHPLRSVQRIAVISGGRIVEEGSPSELAGQSGHYAKMLHLADKSVHNP